LQASKKAPLSGIGMTSLKAEALGATVGALGGADKVTGVFTKIGRIVSYLILLVAPILIVINSVMVLRLADNSENGGDDTLGQWLRNIAVLFIGLAAGIWITSIVYLFISLLKSAKTVLRIVFYSVIIVSVIIFAAYYDYHASKYLSAGSSSVGTKKERDTKSSGMAGIFLGFMGAVLGSSIIIVVSEFIAPLVSALLPVILAVASSWTGIGPILATVLSFVISGITYIGIAAIFSSVVLLITALSHAATIVAFFKFGGVSLFEWIYLVISMIFVYFNATLGFPLYSGLLMTYLPLILLAMVPIFLALVLSAIMTYAIDYIVG